MCVAISPLTYRPLAQAGHRAGARAALSAPLPHTSCHGCKLRGPAHVWPRRTLEHITPGNCGGQARSQAPLWAGGGDRGGAHWLLTLSWAWRACGGVQGQAHVGRGRAAMEQTAHPLPPASASTPPPTRCRLCLRSGADLSGPTRVARGPSRRRPSRRHRCTGCQARRSYPRGSTRCRTRCRCSLQGRGQRGDRVPGG